MDKQMPSQTPSNEMRDCHHSSYENEGQSLWLYMDRGEGEEPSIPVAIALIVATMLLGILLATHWPFKTF
jgi:hypothetical protein